MTKRIRPTSFSMSPEDLPPIPLNRDLVRSRLSSAGIAEDLHDRIIILLVNACHNYVVDRAGDERAATPAEVRKYVSSVRKTMTALVDLLDVENNPVARAVVQRAVEREVLPYGFAQGLQGDALEFTQAAARISSEVGKTRRGGGKEARHNRQVRFARGFVDTFRANGWPTAISHNSLMAQLLGLCLSAVGEEYREPENLLAAASEF